MTGEFRTKNINKIFQIKSRLIYFIFICLWLSLTGCVYSIHNWGEQLNALDTELDKELRKSNINNQCLASDIRYKNAFQMLSMTHVEKRLNEILPHFFLISSPLKEVIQKMTVEGGAKCIYQNDENNNGISHIVCSVSNESVQGMKEFGITGWKKTSAQWQKDNYEIRITAENDRLVNIEGKVLEGECCEIDKEAYELVKTIKCIRKIP